MGALAATEQAQIGVLPLPALEQLAEDLLDFGGVDDLRAWLAQHPPVPASDAGDA